MTPENKTSQAVEKWMRDMEAVRPRTMLPQQLRENMAIAEKYRRMEAELRTDAEELRRQIGFLERNWKAEFGEDAMCGHAEAMKLKLYRIEEALAFDPLSSHE